MLAAFSGFIAVAVGAFAAHGVKDPLAKVWLMTGAQYGFMHTMTTFVCATFIQIGGRRARFAPAFFLPGIVLFSGSLYAMALGGPRWLGAVTPIGACSSWAVGWSWPGRRWILISLCGPHQPRPLGELPQKSSAWVGPASAGSGPSPARPPEWSASWAWPCRHGEPRPGLKPRPRWRKKFRP